GIENIRHMQEETEILIMISTAMRVASVILVLVMCLVAIAIIMNNIKLTVFIRKNEISIMKYVGATDWFIRWPFMIEGLIIGLVGALIPLIICAAGYKELLVMINTEMAMLTSIAEFKEAGELFSVIAPVTLILGMALGALGSITSMRQYLDV
ncbi:MAG: FtsX-like permease family protein, partial [Firmicutes bacterium]|nr:FtsX-like permease family protein [Bacillota bacterium]